MNHFNRSVFSDVGIAYGWWVSGEPGSCVGQDKGLVG